MTKTILLFASVTFLISCSSDKEADKSSLPVASTTVPLTVHRFSKNEEERGQQACKAYVARVCSCSSKSPELKEECELAEPMPGALTFQIRASNAQGTISDRDKAAILASARKTVRKCIEKEVQLDDVSCPRP